MVLRPVRAAPRRRVALRPRRGRHEGGPRRDRRRGARRCAASATSRARASSCSRSSRRSARATARCVRARRPPADAAVITEPTGGAIWIAQVGVLWFSVRVAGRPAHAGEAASGENAIEAMVPVIAALRALEAELNVSPPPPFAGHPHPINLNVGTIRGGDWPSTVAGECVAEMRLALYPGEDVAGLRRARRGDRRRGGGVRRVPRPLHGRGALRRVRLRGLRARARPRDRRRRRGSRARVRRRAAAVRLDGHDRRAHVPSLRRDARDLLRAVRGAIHSVDERVHLPSVVQTAQALALLSATGAAERPRPRSGGQRGRPAGDRHAERARHVHARACSPPAAPGRDRPRALVRP